MSEEAIGRQISNFAHTPFVLDGVEFGSIEAFYVWLLLSTSGDEHKREKVRPMWGRHAKRLAPKNKPVNLVYREISMEPGSTAHLDLIKRALRAKLGAYPEMARDFAATDPRPLEHETGHPDKPDAEFPKQTFCRLLKELRDELIEEFCQSI